MILDDDLGPHHRCLCVFADAHSLPEAVPTLSLCFQSKYQNIDSSNTAAIDVCEPGNPVAPRMLLHAAIAHTTDISVCLLMRIIA